MAEITLVKGETSALDRTWMTMPDGTTRQLAVPGPDTPDGVRAPLRPGSGPATGADVDYQQRVSDLLGRLDDGTIALAISGTWQLSTAWARLPADGMLRRQWPLPRAALGVPDGSVAG